MIATAAPLEGGACAHCQLPMPRGRGGDFCCDGCQIVHDAIARFGLAKFYELRDVGTPARASTRDYGELDDPALDRIHVRDRGEGRAGVALYVEDLRCGACVWLLETAPRCVPGLLEVRVDIGRSRADVTWDRERCSLSAIARHFDRLGHAVCPYRGLDRDRVRRREDRALLIKLGVAGAAFGNLMLLAIGLYAGWFQDMSQAETTLFRWASMAVAVPALAFAASPFFTTAIGALRAKRLHLDLPLAIGIAAGLVWGTANTIRGVGEIYFDSLAMLVFLLLAARWVVLRHQRRAATAAELLLALTPRFAHRVVGDREKDVAVDSLVPDDLVRVRVGETIPVDGVVAAGRSALDVKLLTGESRPLEVAIGSPVHAGTTNLASPLEVMVTAVGEATRIGALVTAIEALAARRAPIERLVDRIAARFVVVIALVAAATFVGWSVTSVELAAEHTMALLVVTCPCALALATPLAVTVALGRAARAGVLIKGADALERLATPGTMFVDKTGTLTEGRIAVASWCGDVDAAPLAAAVERASNHPIARAVVAYRDDGRVAEGVCEQLGRGIVGRVAGRDVAVGSPRWLRERGVAVDPIAGWIDQATARGETPVAVAVDGVAVALAGLADPIRSDARAAVDRLHQLGWRIEILSGDDARVVARVGGELAIASEACHGEVTPEGKAAVVGCAAHAVMVGDGVNDAAAMAAATASVAVSGAAEVAIDTADVYLREPRISLIADVAAGAQATLATIRRNLKFSLAYNTLAGTLAVTGVIHPLIAAVLMPMSSLTVLVSSLRSRAFRARGVDR